MENVSKVSVKNIKWGPANGTDVFFDMDFNGLRSADEPFGLTTADGFVVISGVERADANNNSVLELQEGQWVAEGGIDTSSNRPPLMVLVAPANYGVVSPSSTLISKLVEIGPCERTTSEVEIAANRFLAALGVPDQTLPSLDFIQEAADGNVDAAALFGKETQFYDTVVMVSSFFEELNSGLAFRVLSDIVIEDIACKIVSPGSLLDFGNERLIMNILEGVSVRTGISLAGTEVDVVAKAIANANSAIDAILLEGTRAYLESVVKVQVVAQGELSDNIRLLAKGELTNQQFENCLSNLENAVTDAQAYNVLPVYVNASTASVVEGNDGATTLEFVVTLYGDSALPITVDYRTCNGTALEGEDYLATNGTLAWDAGDATPKVVHVTVAGDVAMESDEYLSLLLSNPTNVTIYGDTTTGTIMNDDTLVHSTPVDAANHLVFSLDGRRVFLEQDGDAIFDGTFKAGANVDLSGQVQDQLVVFSTLSLQTTKTMELSGARVLEADGHTIRVTGIDNVVDDFTAAIAGIAPQLLADIPLSLSADVPASFNEDEVTFAWRLYSADSSTPRRAWSRSIARVRTQHWRSDGRDNDFRWSPQHHHTSGNRGLPC